MRGFVQDVRFAFRMLRKSPGVSAVAVAAMAFAIGATTTVFAVVNATLLHPLPFPDPGERLIAVWQIDPAAPDTWLTTSPGNYADWRQSARSFEALGAGQNRSYTLTSFEDGDTPLMRAVSHDYFTILGVQPQLGRSFTPEEDRAGGPPAVVLSHELWQRRFGGDPGVLGRTTDLDGRSHTIVGVMPEGYDNPVFGLGVHPQAWIPLALPETGLARTGVGLLTVGRLRPGVSLAQAQSELDAISARLREQHPDENRSVAALVEPLDEVIVSRARPGVLLLFGAVTFVLLVACGNVANLLLTRAVERRREIAVRRALGAGTGHLLRQLTTESVALTVAGGALGLPLASWGTGALQWLMPSGPSAPHFDFAVDGTVLAFAVTVSLGTGIVFGLVPLVHALRDDLESGLSAGASRAVGDHRGQRVRAALVVGEIALSLVLLVGAGLTLRSYAELRSADVGFDAESLLTFRVSTRGASYEDSAARSAFFEKVVRELSGLPGARAVGAMQQAPNFPQFFQVPVRLGSAPPAEPGAEPRVAYRPTVPGTLEALGIPLLRGRSLEERDDASGAPVAVINRAMARRMWPAGDCLGDVVTVLDSEGVTREVVGVVGDVRSSAPPYEAEPMLFVPLAQAPQATSMRLFVRTRSLPLGLLPQVEAAVRRVDRGMPVYQVETMRDALDNANAGNRVVTALLGIFAALALVLAVTGLYAMLSYAVSQRTREIGVRMALGADSSDVLRFVMRGAAWLAAIGLATGLTASLGVGRLLGSRLYGVGPTDPATYLGVSVLLGAVVCLASLVPALRASRVDPATALRQD